MIHKQTGETVITAPGEDRRYRMCLCADCDEVQCCIPENDFYATKSKTALRCSSCFRKSLSAEFPAHKISDAI